MSALETLMPPAQYADLGDVRLAYWESGPRRGVPTLLPGIRHQSARRLRSLQKLSPG